MLAELESGFRFNDAVLRHLIVKRDDAVTEMSPIMKNKDDKGDRRRRDDEGFGFGQDDDEPRPRRERAPREEAAAAPAAESAE